MLTFKAGLPFRVHRSFLSHSAYVWPLMVPAWIYCIVAVGPVFDTLYTLDGAIEGTSRSAGSTLPPLTSVRTHAHSS